jgi:hypothetical protein
MRRLLFGLGVVAATAVALLLFWRAQTATLANALTADLAAARQTSIKRDPPPRAPMHQNGYQCLGSMFDVTAADFGAFGAKNAASLEPFITGASPAGEISLELRSQMLAFSPWASALRECGDSMQLSWVEGLSPWATQPNTRWQRLVDAMPALIEFTALELRVLLADGQPEVALERCSATWALAADQSHLGLAGAANARLSLKRLSPACRDALAAVPPEVKAQVAKQWPPLKKRLASTKALVEAERLATSLQRFAWVSDEAVRAKGAVMPAATDFSSRVRAGREWSAWDAAMRTLLTVADSPGPERQRSVKEVDAIAKSQLGTALDEYEQSGAWLDALCDLARGAPARP